MTALLKKLLDEAAKLPPHEQDAFAAAWLQDLASERRWDELFARSQHVLEGFADEARRSRKFSESRHVIEAMVARADAEIDAGEVAPLEFPRRK